MRLEISKRLKIVLTIGIILLVHFGFIGFMVTASNSIGKNHIGKYYNQQSLNDLNGIVVDSNGNIYIGIGVTGSVQVYDSKGDFQYGFKFPTDGGSWFAFGIENDKIHLVTARTESYFIFDKGELVYSEKGINNNRSKELQTKYNMTREYSYETNNKIYEILPFNNISIKNKINGQSNKIHLNAPIWPFHPMVFWLIEIIAIGLLFVLQSKFFISIFKSVRGINLFSSK